MSLCGGPPSIPDPAKAAIAGIQADTELQPFQYIINALSALGQKGSVGGQTFDFTGLGNADTARKVSDQMAATMLALQKEKSPQIIQQRIDELKAADPQGYAARKQLFDRIVADSQANPDRPVSQDLQNELQDQLSKGAGFDDARQEKQVREQARGGQVASGIYLGNAPTTQEAKSVVNAGESLQSQRQQNALAMLQSGTSPEDIAYRRFQQNIANLGNFQSGESPTAQFQQVSGAAHGPVNFVGGAPNTNTFNPGAAGSGMSNALSGYGGQLGWFGSQANPWLSGMSTSAHALGAMSQSNPSWFGNAYWQNGSGAYSGNGFTYNPSLNPDSWLQ